MDYEIKGLDSFKKKNLAADISLDAYNYRSPIEAIVSEITQQQEDNMISFVQSMDLRCDKYELAKALAYDRDQYNQGYHDAALHYQQLADSPWISVSIRLPEMEQLVFIRTTFGDYDVAKYKGDRWESELYTYHDDVQYWFPIPQLPKSESSNPNV